MELLGKLRVSFDEIRALAIQCHALDITAYHLFVDSTHDDKSGKTKFAYQDLMSRQFLGLAIALRTKFYQGLDHKDTYRYIAASGLMYKQKKGAEKSVAFSIKDVCDKIIHADTVSRYMEKGIDKPVTSFRGHEGRNKSDWELGMSVSLFTEGVLNWLQDIENDAAVQQ